MERCGGTPSRQKYLFSLLLGALMRTHSYRHVPGPKKAACHRIMPATQTPEQTESRVFNVSYKDHIASARLNYEEPPQLQDSLIFAVIFVASTWHIHCHINTFLLPILPHISMLRQLPIFLSNARLLCTVHSECYLR